MKITIAAIAAIALAAGGCAGTPRQYEVDLDLSSPAKAYPTARVPSTPIRLGVVDNRARKLVGKWEVVGIEVRAPSLMSEVEAAIESTFTRKGYRLTSGEQARAAVEVRLRGTSFDYTPGVSKLGEHVSAVIFLTARKDGATGGYEKTYRSVAERRRFMWAFEDEVDRLLNHHLTAVIRQIADDEALHRFLTE